jgi:hypothetical protein
LTNKITGAYVYFNNQLVGVYDLPADVPVIADGPGTILVNAGIDFTGMKNFMAVYPFYNSDSFSLTPAPGKKHVFNPVITYRSAAQIRYKEDFEVGNTFIATNADLTDDTTLVRTNNPSLVWNGKGGSGYIYLTNSNKYSSNINNSSFPIASGESYIEIDYKCSVEFQVGLQAMSAGSPIIEPIATIKSNEKWNKLYIGLQTMTSKYPTGPYRITVTAELPDGQTEGYIIIDNIKVISY